MTERQDIAMSKPLARKLLGLAETCRRNGYTQPVSLDLTIPEVRELAAIADGQQDDKQWATSNG